MSPPPPDPARNWRGLVLAAAALSALAGAARAAELTVKVTTPEGRPVADAVVMVRPRAARPPGPIRFPWPMVVEQKEMQFRPFVLIAPVGAEVAFPNHDPYRHHVYSFSPAKRFELKLYGHDEARTVKFDKPGVIALGCNIHDDMAAFVRVVDTPYAAKTGANGEAAIHDLPAGGATLVVWRPYIKGDKDVTREISLPASGAATASVTAEVRPAPMHHGGY